MMAAFNADQVEIFQTENEAFAYAKWVPSIPPITDDSSRILKAWNVKGKDTVRTNVLKLIEDAGIKWTMVCPYGLLNAGKPSTSVKNSLVITVMPGSLDVAKANGVVIGLHKILSRYVIKLSHHILVEVYIMGLNCSFVKFSFHQAQLGIQITECQCVTIVVPGAV